VKLKIVTTNSFNSDLIRIRRNLGRDAIVEIIESLDILADERRLPDGYQDHQLSEYYSDEREYHVRDDLFVIYHINDNELILVAVRAGSHQELFG
jgi:mRNA interferase YafQ